MSFRSPALHQSDKAARRLVYRLDHEDCLVYFSPEWMDAAQQAGASDLQPEHLLGRRLWLCVRDVNVRDIYVALVGRARMGHPSRFVYRCDAPGWQRWFTMTIYSPNGRDVEFSSVLDRQEPRAIVPLLDAVDGRDPEWLVPMCSWCHAVSLGGGHWVPLEKGVEAGACLAGEKLPALDFTICPECRELIQGKLNS